MESGIEPDRWLELGDRAIQTGLALLSGNDDERTDRTYPQDMPPLSG